MQTHFAPRHLLNISTHPSKSKPSKTSPAVTAFVLKSVCGTWDSWRDVPPPLPCSRSAGVPAKSVWKEQTKALSSGRPSLSLSLCLQSQPSSIFFCPLISWKCFLIGGVNGELALFSLSYFEMYDRLDPRSAERGRLFVGIIQGSVVWEREREGEGLTLFPPLLLLLPFAPLSSSFWRREGLRQE